MSTNTRDTPVEALERALPIRVRRFTPRHHSGGTGEFPGGNESRAERLPDKVTIEPAPGDVLRMLTPGGGGWGAP